jgi:putative effector of murein hydrolase
MNERFAEIWVYLAASPLLGLTLTLLAYQGAVWLHRRCHGHPLVNPVLIAISILVFILWLTGTPYHVYFDGAQFVHFLLGPATVALAVPLYGQLDRLMRMAMPLLLALIAGSLTASVSALLIGKLFGASKMTMLSLAPKSVTTPIAMGIAERIGGLPSLTSVLVILTGVIGAVAPKASTASSNARIPLFAVLRSALHRTALARRAPSRWESAKELSPRWQWD